MLTESDILNSNPEFKCINIKELIDIYEKLDKCSKLDIDNIVPDYANYSYGMNISELFAFNVVYQIMYTSYSFHDANANIRIISGFVKDSKNLLAKVIFSGEKWSKIQNRINRNYIHTNDRFLTEEYINSLNNNKFLKN